MKIVEKPRTSRRRISPDPLRAVPINERVEPTFPFVPERTAGSDDDVRIVEALPRRPIATGRYSFARVTRKQVIDHNHALHKYPAKFIPQIPRWALTFEPLAERGVVLDPFCGSGTSLVEAGLHGAHAVGFDINPLAICITLAKCWTPDADIADRIIHDIIVAAKRRYRRGGISGGDLHNTWDFWFDSDKTNQLVALKCAIDAVPNAGLANFLRSCLSSVMKSASYLDEDQIKVRYVGDKALAEPFESFEAFAEEALREQRLLGQAHTNAGAQFTIRVADAANLPLATNSVDRIITSPPYINAIDYTMAHKYNLFLLGLVCAADFKEHCRKYIGMTERAVRSSDIEREPAVNSDAVRPYVRELWNLNTSTARNRAYIVATYFDGMAASFREARRVLRDNAACIVVVGESNRICGLDIPTAELLVACAVGAGLTNDFGFHHELANRSSMRLNRGATGGLVKTERILVFRK